mmetsp:Transcript_64643/g.153194  ORF Transcript_64643/g.153194 Transcript_64643/m.153194 type:complete len:191 (-) Transcript_64643:28-600(-)
MNPVPVDKDADVVFTSQTMGMRLETRGMAEQPSQPVRVVLPRLEQGQVVRVKTIDGNGYFCNYTTPDGLISKVNVRNLRFREEQKDPRPSIVCDALCVVPELHLVIIDWNSVSGYDPNSPSWPRFAANMKLFVDTVQAIPGCEAHVLKTQAAKGDLATQLANAATLISTGFDDWNYQSETLFWKGGRSNA